MTAEKMNELMQNEEFLKALAASDTKEEFQMLFAEQGVELTMEEIDNILQTVTAGRGDGELDDALLDGVNGGIAVTTCCIWLLRGAVTSAICSAGRLILAYY